MNAVALHETAALVDYLRMIAGFRRDHLNVELAYAGMEDVVLRHGRLFVRDGTEPPRDFPDDVRQERACFGNAFQTIIHGAFQRDEWAVGLTYVEGVAIPVDGVLPVHHAWLVDADGNVYDPTWPHEQAVYAGVAFTEDAVFRQAAVTEHDTMFTHRFPYAEPLPDDWLAPSNAPLVSDWEET